MSNHVHLIGSSTCNDLSGLLRDIKKFTSTKIIEAIDNHSEESRKEWMLPMFKGHGKPNSRNTENQFWRQDNAPMECYSPRFTIQKLTYIHNNPVEAGLVEKPEDYIYSSAKAYHNHTNNGLLQVEFL